MKWYFAYSATLQCKSHMMPAELKDEIINNLNERECGEQVLREETRIVIDLPGPMMVDRYMCDFKVDGMTLSIPASDVEFFFEELKALPERKELPGKTYYKLHGGYVCFCMTPEQKKILESEMLQQLSKAKIIAETEREEFIRRVERINEEMANSSGAQFLTKDYVQKKVDEKKQEKVSVDKKYFTTKKKEWLN